MISGNFTDHWVRKYLQLVDNNAMATASDYSSMGTINSIIYTTTIILCYSQFLRGTFGLKVITYVTI